MSSENLERLIDRLEQAVEEAPPDLRTRSEWRSLDAFHRALPGRRDELLADPDTLDTVLREGEAGLDLLELARAEVALQTEIDDRTRSERLRTDEDLLGAIRHEMKFYAGSITLGFVLPVLLLFPLRSFLVLGALPSVLGFARMYKLTIPTRGRIWIVLQDEVNHVLGRVKLLHSAAIGSLLLTTVWVVVANLLSASASQ